MVTNTRYLLARLSTHRGEVLPVARRVRAGEHEVIPHHQTELVADIIEHVMLVNASAPETYKIHVCVDHRLHDRLVVAPPQPCYKRMRGNPVRALCKDKAPIHAQAKAAKLRAVGAAGHVVKLIRVAI